MAPSPISARATITATSARALVWLAARITGRSVGMRSTPVTEMTRYFDVNEARPAVQALAAMVGTTGRLPPGVGGPAADGVMVVRVLKHLGFNWAKEMPALIARAIAVLAKTTFCNFIFNLS